MSKITQCDLCKKCVDKGQVWVIQINKRNVSDNFYLREPNYYLELCQDCGKIGISFLFSKDRFKVTKF